jgi:DNA-directed RNA polymerase subunit beta'
MADQKYTTPGSVMIKHMLPVGAREKYDLHRVLDKGGVQGLIQLLIKNEDSDFEVINDLARLFFGKATEIGASTPLSDYINDSSERAALLGEFEHKVAEILKSKVSTQEKSNALSTLAADMSGKISKQNINYLASRGSTAAKMAATGARGNPSQLAWGTSSPLMAADVRGMPVPIAVMHSFAEGLTPGEYLAMSYAGRASTVAAQLSTSLPGALFKKLTPNVYHEVVTVPDCHTVNGVMTPSTDRKALIGRYEAGTNKFIDETYQRELEQSHKQVKVRNTMTCEAKKGVCQKCYGQASDGHLVTIGTNVGVIASQSVSERLTQAMLGTKHSGGVAGKKRNAYEEASNLLNNPADNFQDEATISKLNGTVSEIRQTALKDHEIYVNGVPHFVSREQDLTVKKGQEMKAGDQMSTGTVNPRKLVSLKGVGAGRLYMANKLRDIYGSGLDTRHFDLIARNLIKYVKVNDPGETGFLPGQEIDVNQIQDELAKNSEAVPIHSAVGRTLSHGVLEEVPGTYLTQNHVDSLAMRGISSIHATTSGLKVTPLVPGLQSAKLLDPNWISKLAFNKIRSTIQESAAIGSSSKIHDTDPITPYVMGRDFGQGNPGEY